MCVRLILHTFVETFLVHVVKQHSQTTDAKGGKKNPTTSFAESRHHVAHKHAGNHLLWPIRWQRAAACRSFWGLKSLSMKMTVSAAVRFRPTPPAKTAQRLRVSRRAQEKLQSVPGNSGFLSACVCIPVAALFSLQLVLTSTYRFFMYNKFCPS